MKIPPNVSLIATVLLGTSALHGCGGGGGTSATTTTSAYVSDEVEFLVNYMEKSYLFYQDIQANDVSSIATPEKALELRKAKQDRFSNIASAAASDALFTEGQITAFGFNQKLEDDKLLRITFVQPNSPAQAAGMKRGDAIVAIDGESVASLLSKSLLADAFGPFESGIRRTISILRGAQAFDLALIKATFTLQNASLGKTIPLSNGTKAGYLYYNSFNSPSLSQWKSALSTMKAQGATKLVVDLRLNGGGLVNIATSLGGTLVPTNKSGNLFVQTAFNDKSTTSNVSYTIPFDSLAGTFTEIVFLTSPSTCSASEALIVGLQPYLASTKVTLIGSTTCGKPFGFSPPVYKSKIYNITSFRIKNLIGFTDYIDGLTPNCKATDNNQLELGDEKENLLAAALSYFNTGVCPIVATTFNGSEKSYAQINAFERSSDYWHLPKERIALETGIQ
jgi:carboxyl-terminal processing protease